MDTVSNADDIIDTRDLIATIDRIEAELEEDEELAGADRDDLVAELAVLRDFASECETFPDYRYGVTLVSEGYFETYAHELADDIGAYGSDVQWPYTCIDWEQAADELKIDYTAVDFDGVTYWGR